MPFPLIPLAMFAASKVGERVLNNSSADRAQKKNKEFWDYTFSQQNDRQDFLNENGATIQKNAMRSAGLSAASMDSAPFSETVAGGTAGSQTAMPQTLNPLELAQLQQMTATTEGIEIDNKNKQREKDDAHALNDVTVALQRASEQYTTGKNERESAQNEKSLELMSKQIDFQDALKAGKLTENDINSMAYKAMNETYEFNGKTVKGYQLENFNTIFAYQLAKKANDIALQNANINAKNAETNLMNAKTNEASQLRSIESIASRYILLPMVKWIMDKVPNGDEIVAGLKTELQNIGIIDKDGKPVMVSPTGPTP